MPNDNLMAEVYMKIEDIVDGINSGDEKKEITATHAACKILTRECDPPIDVLINANVVPKLVEFLSRVNNLDLQYASARALIEIVSGTSDQAKAVVSAGAVAGFITLLGSPDPDVNEGGVIAIGIIAKMGPELRDHVIEQGILEPLLRLIKHDDVELLREVSFTLAWLLFNEELSPLSVPAFQQLLPALAHLIQINDYYILSSACRGLFYLTNGPNKKIQEVVDAGFVPLLVTLLDHNEVGLSIFDKIATATAEPAVTILGCIARGGPELRDHVIEQGILKPLLSLIKPDASVSLLHEVTLTLSKLCSYEELSPLSVPAVQQLLPALAHLINNNEEEILTIACRALFYLTEGPNERMQEVVDAGVVPRLVTFLDRNEVAVIYPTLKIIGKIVAGSDTRTDLVLAAGAWPLLVKLLVHSDIFIVRRAAEIASKIAAVTRPLVDVARKGDLKCPKEATWDITSNTLDGNFKNNAIGALCPLLKVKEPETIEVVVDGLSLILEAAVKMDELEKVSLHAKKCGGMDCIMALKSNENTEIRQKTLAILERYFSTHLSNEDKSAPSTSGVWTIAPCN